MSFLAGRQRWLIVALLFFLSTINYLDRQSLSVLAPTLRETLNFTVEQYSYIVSTFLLAYTIGYLFCGRIIDRFGPKVAIGTALAFWSIAACLHSMAHSWRHLAAFRFLLGLGESFNAPGGAKVIREWVPSRERALSMAVFSTGNVAGAIIAPPLVSFLAMKFDWRIAFLITGAVGFVWLAVWWRTYHPVETHPKLMAEERKLILEGRAAASSQKPPAFWAIVRHPLTISFILARFLTDTLAYFFSFWMPEYLRRGHGLTLAEIGMLAWIPYLAADIGGISGGASSDWLVRRGWNPVNARRRILLIAACLTPMCLAAMHVESAYAALACIGIVLAAQSAWMTNLLTAMTESMPPQVAGQVVAWSGIGGSIGGALANLATGYVIAKHGYGPIFTSLAFVHLTALAILTAGWFFNAKSNADRNSRRRVHE